MISKAFRLANQLWDKLSLSERESVLFDLGLIEEFAGGNDFFSELYDQLCESLEGLSLSEGERFKKKILASWEHAQDVQRRSLAFLGKEEEGYTHRIIVALGQSQAPLKSRNISNLLLETGSAPKNTRNLLSQLERAGKVEILESEAEGEPLFRLTAKGMSFRNDLLSV